MFDKRADLGRIADFARKFLGLLRALLECQANPAAADALIAKHLGATAGAKAAIESIPKFNWKIIGLITGSIVLYGLLLPKMGFIVAVLVLVMVASSASREFSWKVALINAVVLIAFTYSVFVLGLKLQFPLLPFFLQQ